MVTSARTPLPEYWLLIWSKQLIKEMKIHVSYVGNAVAIKHEWVHIPGPKNDAFLSGLLKTTKHH